MNIRIKSVKAYSSVSNKTARWPEQNVTDVTKKELIAAVNDDDYDFLLLTAPTVDINNQLTILSLISKKSLFLVKTCSL